MRITFVLPCYVRAPVGGYKTAYEYANRLCRRGHEVYVIHPRSWEPRSGIPARLEFLAWRLRNRIFDRSRIPWFALDSGVQLLFPPDLRERYLPDADILIATAWQTAEWTQRATPRKGVKAYLVQDYEYFMSADRAVRERMAETYRQGMLHLAISPACEEMVQACGGRASYIPLGMEQQTFGCDVAVDDPTRRWVGFPVRGEPFKRTGDAIEAMQLLRDEMGASLKVWAFGGRPPAAMPDWIEYHERPGDAELRALYNRTAVFAVPSQYEGWGLPGSEAMLCGAALASTDNGGVRAYAEDGVTALLSPPGAPERLASNVARLLNDAGLRMSLAGRGMERVRQLNWERSADAFEAALLERLRLERA